MPCKPAAVGVISTTRPCFLTVGLFHRSCLALASSTKVSCGRKRARMTNTSRNRIGASKSLAISVSHCAHSLGFSLPARKFFRRKACASSMEAICCPATYGSFPVFACHGGFKSNPRGCRFGAIVCRAVPKEVPLWLWVTRVLQSTVCHAKPMNQEKHLVFCTLYIPDHLGRQPGELSSGAGRAERHGPCNPALWPVDYCQIITPGSQWVGANSQGIFQ